jgi:hypothetical protein
MDFAPVIAGPPVSRRSLLHYHDPGRRLQCTAAQSARNKTGVLSYSLKCQKYQHQTRRKCKFFAQKAKENSQAASIIEIIRHGRRSSCKATE